jgi:prepilin peptidase CpaA
MTVPLVVVLSASLVAAATDVWKFWVPNLLTLPLLASGLIYHGMSGGAEGLLASFLGALFGFGILFIFYLLGGMGAGDVKLLAGIGAWLKVDNTLYVFVAAGLVAGIYSLILILMYSSFRDTYAKLRIIWFRLAILGRYLGSEESAVTDGQPVNRRRLIPFAAMVALGLIGLAAYWVLNSHL